MTGKFTVVIGRGGYVCFTEECVPVTGPGPRDPVGGQ